MLGTQHNCNSRNELKGNLWDRYMWLFTSGGGRHVPGICLAPNKSKNNLYGEMNYDDLNVHDMTLLLNCVCPNLYQLYPSPILLSHLPVLLPLARRLEMPNLLLCCEKVLEDDLENDMNHPRNLLISLDFAIKYDFNVELQARLLRRLLRGTFPEDITNENLFYEKTGHIIALAHIQFLKKRFSHASPKIVEGGEENGPASGRNDDAHFCYGLKERS
ncbi:unnamed protein product [Enterobius vermicularis]|uniref:BTB domain-containing protein n=1 Tax=Enterobius vermicularis TaxID=51028 RepID=A0A0N4VCD1_ENTVE|nr:unnamed protein product [Enterobius vermicularis]